MVKIEPQGTGSLKSRDPVFFEGELMKQAIRDKNSLKLFRNY